MEMLQGPILRANAAARYLSISRSQFYRLVRTGRITRGVKLSDFVVGYPQPELDAFIARCATQNEVAA